MSETIIVDGKKFIISKQAAKLSGYTRDYIGQLCRMGKIEGRVVQRVLYVSEDSLTKYKAMCELLLQQKPSSISGSIYAATGGNLSIKKAVKSQYFKKVSSDVAANLHHVSGLIGGVTYGVSYCGCC